ncbi:hypothetical protein [Peptoniphilus sp. HCN-40583]|uniref:hypothetical protein n=1 Tax=Peptoniphilus sp. HCN-40583 TaxID=3134662 RepID=UPI0030ED9E98
MTYEDAKKAFNDRSKVRHKGIEYQQINAIIFRRIDGEKVIQLELQDTKAKSVTIARLEGVSL